MSSIQMLQFVVPALEAWFPLAALRHRLLAWARRRPTPQGADEAFRRALLATTEAASLFGECRVSVVVEAFATPLPDERERLLQLAGILVDDAVRHNLSPDTVGIVRVSVERIGERLRLVIEDDGWAPRSAKCWLTHNRIARELAATGDGWMQRELEWAFNRVVVVFPCRCA